YLHFLEHVEVVIGWRRAGRRHVGDRDAVDVPRVVAARRPLGLVIRLLARLGAADVHAIDDDAGDGLEDDPRVARRGNALQLLDADVGGGRHLLGVDHRRFAGDLYLRRDAGDRQ